MYIGLRIFVADALPTVCIITFYFIFVVMIAFLCVLVINGNQPAFLKCLVELDRIICVRNRKARTQLKFLIFGKLWTFHINGNKEVTAKGISFIILV